MRIVRSRQRRQIKLQHVIVVVFVQRAHHPRVAAAQKLHNFSVVLLLKLFDDRFHNLVVRILAVALLDQLIDILRSLLTHLLLDRGKHLLRLFRVQLFRHQSPDLVRPPDRQLFLQILVAQPVPPNLLRFRHVLRPRLVLADHHILFIRVEREFLRREQIRHVSVLLVQALDKPHENRASRLDASVLQN